MDRSSAKKLSAFLVSAFAFLFLTSAVLFAADSREKKTATVTPKSLHPAGQAKVTGLTPLRSHLKRPIPGLTREIPIGPGGHGANPNYKGTDPVVQRDLPSPVIPEPLITFEGVGDVNGVQPADTTLAIGPDHVFQWVNLSAQIFDKLGNDLSGGPFDGTAFYQDLGGDCANINGGDIIVIYDHLAQRWVATQIAPQIFGASTNWVCFAVSVTDDPLGEYYQWAFDYGSTLNDYPKWALWPDAYYGTFRDFLNSDVWSGMNIWAVDRLAVLAGAPDPLILAVDVGDILPNLDGLLAANLSPGNNVPPALGQGGGAVPAETLFSVSNPGIDGDDSAIRVFKFHPDFVDPENSTFSGPVDLPVSDFTAIGFFAGVEQPPPGGELENLGWIMYKADYRNFGTHEGVVLSHAVDLDGTSAVRWYEVRDPRNAPALFQEGTFSPDSENRWFPSIAQDFSGNIAVGYSVASLETFPSIRYAGRLVGDPLGDLSQGEGEFFAGVGSFNGFRWGDYATISLDPVDQCTFWFTTMYVASEGLADWSTGIGAFKFPSCTTGPSGTLEGTVTDGVNPIEDAIVSVGPGTGAHTNAAGFYSMVIPVGTYDVTASKYGYLPATAPDVEVTEDNTTTQDFTLEVAPTSLVNGTVRDAAGNWPLYAKIQITGPGFPGATLWTNPVTGYYSITLVEGITYNFTITAFSKGYATGGGPLPLGVPLGDSPLLVQNWTLEQNGSCTAPGYSFSSGSKVDEDFALGEVPPGWTITFASGIPWRIFDGSDPCGLFGGNQTGGSGPYALVNSNCDGQVQDDTNLITPPVNLTGVGSPVLQFKSDFAVLDEGFPQTGTVDYSTDGGANWTNVLTLTTDTPGPQSYDFPLPAAANQSNVLARFHFDGFWAWWWQVDDVLFGDPSGELGTCDAGTGGLVVGNVRDAATGEGLNGATVTNLTGGGSTKTVATPDPAVDEGFYTLYAEAGSNTFEATKDLYQADQDSTVVVPGSTVQLNFSLLSGNLSVTPTQLDGRVNPGGTDEAEMTVTNTGAAPAHFELIEINAPLLPTETHGFANEAKRQQALARLPGSGKEREHTARTALGLAPMPNREAPGRPLAVGDVLSKFDSGIAYGWGVATIGSNIWLSNLGVAGGDDLDYEYAGDGSPTGNTIDDSVWIGEWAADGAQDVFHGTFWRVNVGGDNCIYELDPSTQQPTGDSICGSPWAGISQRGLAFDAGNDAFFIGGWNEGVIYHIDRDGNVIDSSFVGLSIAGLAYNASNGHLLVMESTLGTDMTVLDALDNYNSLGSFNVVEDGNRVFADGGQAGIEFDCLGKLWAINQYTQIVYQVESGEVTGCEVDIPWFSVNPTEGTVGPALRQGVGNSLPVTASWDAGTLLPGLQLAQLAVKTDTPHQVPGIPVTLTVRFLDVPDGNQFDDYIYAAAGAGVMFGGPPVCPAGVLYFCPDGVVTRADMAGYLWRAINGRNTPPPVYQNIFADVTFNDYNAFYIQGIYDLGITAGCQDGTVYCPNDANTRAQMSVFIWKGEHGEEAPPACSGVFNDVPCPSLFADYIEAIYNEGVTAGCGGGNFCPNANITNGQMSVFLVKAFGIPVVIFP